MKRRLVTKMPNGQLRIEIDKRVKLADGKVERFRIRRLLPANTTQEEAAALASKLEHGLLVKSAAVEGGSEWCDYVNTLSAAPKSWLYATLQNAKARAKARGLPCTVTVTQLRQIMLRSNGRCEVTGLRFSTVNDAGTRCRPYFHSLDRIAAAQGYTADNLRLVCHAVNIAMNAWGEEVFAEMARGFVFNRYSAFNMGNN